MARQNIDNGNSKRDENGIPYKIQKNCKDENGQYVPKTRNTHTKISYKTFNGHKLTIKEAKFIDLYIETGNGRQSVIQAGYKTTSPGQYSCDLLNKKYIAEEITHRLEQLEEEKIASASEIMQYFTSVMRGEVKDQFGLDTPLSERTRAAQELAKRKIDIAQKVANKAESDGNTVVIKLEWDGIKKEENADENE